MSSHGQVIDLNEVRPHDLVRATSIVRAPGDWLQGGSVTDVVSKVELLHRPSRKPPVGTILTGKQVKARQWKRGTKFCYIKRGDMTHPLANPILSAPLYSVIELTRCGNFIRTDNDSIHVDYIGDEAEFILVYRPEEESDRREES